MNYPSAAVGIDFEAIGSGGAGAEGTLRSGFR